MTDKTSMPVCPQMPMEMVVTQIDIPALEESKSLETLGAMLVQMVNSVCVNRQDTNNGRYNMFNKRIFVRDMELILKFVNREFPPQDE